MDPKNLRTLGLIALFVVALAAFEAANGEWLSAGFALIVSALFVGTTVGMSMTRAAQTADSAETEFRTRRLIARVVPLFLIFFIALAVYSAIDGDWFGTGWAAICFGLTLVGLQLNRRWLAERRHFHS